MGQPDVKLPGKKFAIFDIMILSGRILLCTLCLAVLLLLPPALTAQDAILKGIVIEGNDSIPRTELLNLLGLVPGTKYSFPFLKSAADGIIAHYHARGYVHARLAGALIDLDGTLRLKICEGRIAFIRIINKNLYTIYRFKRALSLRDGQVYNKQMLDREMEKLKKKFGLRELTYFTKPVNGEPGLLNVFINAQGYKAKSFGWTFDAEAFYLIPKVSYRNYDFWGIKHEIYFFADTKLEPFRFYDHNFGMEYFIPPVFGKVIRPLLRVDAELLEVSRKDLNIKHDWNRVNLGLSLENRLAEFLTLRAGISHMFYSINNVDPLDSGSPMASPGIDLGNRTLTRLDLQFDFLDPEGRFNRDKAFRLQFNATAFLTGEKKDFYQLWLSCQKTFERNYDDMVFSFRYWLVTRAAEYFNDVQVTAHTLRGYEPDLIFSRHALSLNVEYKLSLWKNHIKLVFFADSALYRPLSYETGFHESRFVLRGSFGEGFEVNYSEFSLRLYYGVPYQNDLTDGRFKLQLRKVF